MHTNLLPHAIDREFPELAISVERLKKSDAHFALLLTQHDTLDAQITKDEMGVSRMGDVSLETLKKQRLHLKDELYRRASAVKSN